MDTEKDFSFTFFDLINSLLKHWKLIFWNTFIVGVIAIVVSLVLPKWYSAKIEILPPTSGGQPSVGGLSQLVGGGGGGAFSLGQGLSFSLPMMMTKTDLWSAMVQSRAVSDSLIKDYNLQQRFDTKTMQATREVFWEHLSTEITEEGILSISYESKVPAFAAKMANDIGERLDKLNRRIRSKSARQTKHFIREQLDDCKQNLERAGEKLTKFQKKHKTVSLNDQTRLLIGNLADLKGQLLINQVKRDILKKSYRASHAKIRKLQSQINSIKKQISQIQSGKGLDETQYPFNMSEIPTLMRKYAALKRNVKVQEALYEFLIQQYEQAKIREKKDTPVLQFLEIATKPEKKSRPKRKIIVIAATFFAFFLSAVVSTGSEAIRRHQQVYPNKYKTLKQRFQEILKYFKLKSS